MSACNCSISHICQVMYSTQNEKAPKVLCSYAYVDSIHLGNGNELQILLRQYRTYTYCWVHKAQLQDLESRLQRDDMICMSCTIS